MRVLILIIAALYVMGCGSFGKRDSELAELHLRVGTSQLQSGDYPSALKELLHAESLDPNNSQIQNNLGLAYYVRDRFDLAEVHIRKALTLDPKYTDARNNLSRVLIDRAKYSEAAQEARMVIADLTFPTPEKGWINLGIAQFKLNQFDESKRSFLKAIQLQKENCLANSYFGRSLFELKDYKKSTEALDKAVGYCQSMLFDEPHYYSAMSYLQMGDKKRAEARFDEVIKLYPNGKYIDKSKEWLEMIRK